MTGCMLVADDFCLVITEGSLKSQKKYNRLMLNRIDWNPGQEDEQPGDTFMSNVRATAHACVMCAVLLCKQHGIATIHSVSTKGSLGIPQKFLSKIYRLMA